jgi:hypothetical protein
MVRLVRHRQTKGPVSARPHLNRRATPRLHPACAVCSPILSRNQASNPLIEFIVRHEEPFPCKASADLEAGKEFRVSPRTCPQDFYQSTIEPVIEQTL